MRVRFEKIREEPHRWDETVEIGPEALKNRDVVSVGPVHWTGEMRWADPGYLLRSSYEYRQTLSCTRCLKPLDEDVDDGFELLFLTDVEEPTEEEVELEEEDLGIVHLQEVEELELDPYLVEELQLNIPMKPLCRPDCAGLCPVCGRDLNEGKCDCRKESVDPRWAALEGLRRSMSED